MKRKFDFLSWETVNDKFYNDSSDNILFSFDYRTRFSNENLVRIYITQNNKLCYKNDERQVEGEYEKNSKDYKYLCGGGLAFVFIYKIKRCNIFPILF